MYSLGINAAFHDSAACLVEDGRVIAAAEEERFTGIKHGKRPVPFSAYELPFHAIDFCLCQTGIELHDVDHIGYSFDPQLFHPAGSPWDPLFLSYIRKAPMQLLDGVPHHLQRRFREAAAQRQLRWHYVDHHVAHAASAFLASPHTRAAVMTLDGRGERATTSYYCGAGNSLELIKEVRMPHSLGLLYEQVTSHLGFLHSSDEYKVMALASFGKPAFAEAFNRIIRVKEDGTYEIEPRDFEKIFGPRRLKDEAFQQRHFDIAHSLQTALEKAVLKLAGWLHQQTSEDNLCLAGGVALNCVLNARLRDEGPFKKVWVQPAAGDAGTALGAALWVDSQNRPEAAVNGHRPYVMEHAYLGPEFSDEKIEEFLRWSKVSFERLTDVPARTAQLLVEDKVIGWFQGRMEFGPRALGSRSIIASPIHAQMQARLNEIKDREDFRPVAPVVLEEEAANWFENADVSPFMLFVYDVKPQRASAIGAVCHVDGTARIQTVRADQNLAYYRMIKAFFDKTGVPILINTSFNTRGKPIVCSIRDAVECFWTSPIDALVIGSYLLEKKAL